MKGKSMWELCCIEDWIFFLDSCGIHLPKSTREHIEALKKIIGAGE
jgi:hypothetical protein